MTRIRTHEGSREMEEWVGSNPDTKVPAHVRVRIFEREKGICHLSGRKITPADKWELDHGRALINGGEHRETNLFPAIVARHKEKTKADVKEKSKTYKRKARHYGVKTNAQFPKQPNPWNKWSWQ